MWKLHRTLKRKKPTRLWAATMFSLRSLLKSDIPQARVEDILLDDKEHGLVTLVKAKCADSRQLIELLKHCYGLTDGPHKWFEHLCRYLKILGYQQSKLDPCVFYLFEADTSTSTAGSKPSSGKLCGILGIATDDVFHGGMDKHWDNTNKIATTYKLGKNQTTSGRFTGKEIQARPDGTISITQTHYVDDKVKCTPIETENAALSIIARLRRLLNFVSSWVSWPG